MDPMESLSTGLVPKDFNAEDAGNMEEVRLIRYPWIESGGLT